jgi:hypothetical protein
VAVVGSANSSTGSAGGLIRELVAILRRRPGVTATRQQIETIARRSKRLDPITVADLIPLFRPGREFPPVTIRNGGKRIPNKVRAWCIGTHYASEHDDVERARQHGIPKAEQSAQSRLGERWRKSYRIDDDISWHPSDAGKFELGDNIFEVIEEKVLRPPGVLVHKEPSRAGRGVVFFICRERKLRSRQMKRVRMQTGRRTFSR